MCCIAVKHSVGFDVIVLFFNTSLCTNLSELSFIFFEYSILRKYLLFFKHFSFFLPRRTKSDHGALCIQCDRILRILDLNGC